MMLLFSSRRAVTTIFVQLTPAEGCDKIRHTTRRGVRKFRRVKLYAQQLLLWIHSLTYARSPKTRRKPVRQASDCDSMRVLQCYAPLKSSEAWANRWRVRNDREARDMQISCHDDGLKPARGGFPAIHWIPSTGDKVSGGSAALRSSPVRATGALISSRKRSGLCR